MLKGLKVTLFAFLFVVVAVLIGLICTGRYVGWGPFIFLKWNAQKPYVASSEEYNYDIEKFTVENDGEKINGRIYKPNNNTGDGRVLIISQGFTGCMRSGRDSSESFAKSGITVVTFDFRGGSNYSESEGDTMNMSLDSEISDLNAVIDKVKTWDFVDNDKVILMGFSFGGMVSALTAAQRDDIYKLLLIYPAFSTSDDLKAEYPTKADIPDTDNRGIKVGKPYFDSLYEFDPYKYIGNYKNEVYIIHGTGDKLVPYSYSIKADELYKNSLLYLIDGGQHGFTGEDFEDYIKHAYIFITK